MKIIQVGMGGMGNTWLSAVIASPEVEHAGFVEVNDTIAAEQAQRYDLPTDRIFHTLTDALASVDVDGVIDVTPPQFHPTISLTALEAGIPVLSEKPLSDTLDTARTIVQKSNETGVLHMVAQDRRYSLPAQTLNHVIKSGEMGAIASVSVEFFKGPHFGGFRDTMPYPLIIDMAIHHFDMMRLFLDADVDSLIGQSWNPSWSWYQGDASASVLLEFETGVHVSYTGSWCSTGAETSWNAHWRFECANGVILMRDDEVYIQPRLDTRVNEGSAWQYENSELRLVEPVQPQYTRQDYVLHEFYEAVSKGTPPVTTCQDNIQSLAIVFGALRSFETHQHVRLSDILTVVP